MRTIALVCVSWGMASSAAAQPSCRDASEETRARALESYASADVPLREERYEAARALLEDAGRVCQHPSILRDLARALRALGRLVEARAAIARAIELADPERDRVVSETGPAFLGEIEAELGRFLLSGLPPGTDVEVDGDPAEPTRDGVRWVSPGAHVVTIRSDGHEPERLELSIAAGETVRRRITLRPGPTVGSAADATASGGTGPDGGLLAAGIVLGLVGAGGLATGGGLFAGREDAVRARDAAERDGMQPLAESHWRSAQDLSLGMGAALVAGGITLVGGIALLGASFAVGSSGSDAPRARLGVSPTGVRVDLEF